VDGYWYTGQYPIGNDGIFFFHTTFSAFCFRGAGQVVLIFRTLLKGESGRVKLANGDWIDVSRRKKTFVLQCLYNPMA
jgi:hypothetical protein